MLKNVLFTLVQLTWGLPQTAAGALVWLFSAGSRRFVFHGAQASAWKLRRGLSLGLFIFVPDGLSEKLEHGLLVHEYGHSIQSLLFGPLYLPLFVLPSLVWAGLPAMERHRKRSNKSYYSLYTERLANYLGERFTGEKSPGQQM